MNNEILVEKIVQSLLSLQVEAVQNDIVKLTGTSKNTPVKVKVKVRKKDKANTYHNVISLAKRHPTNSAIEKICLVNSDQTIMSLDMIMETDQTLSTKKHRYKFFELLRPGICLGNPNDDRESYQPSQNLNNYEITSKPDEVLKKQLALSKNDYFDISTVVSKRNQNFLGKCKPGGCLDPPFGEDKYSYTPIEKHLQLETSTFTPKTLYLGDDVRALKRDSLIRSTSSKEKLSQPDSTTGLKIIQAQPQTNSILNLYRAESVNTSLSVTYSNPIITYPPPLTPSEIRLNNEKIMQERISADNKSRKSFNEFSSTYFISSKEIKNQIEHKNYEQEMLRFKDEKISFPPPFCMKNESSSVIKKDHLSSPVQSDKKIENVHRELSRIVISPTKQIEQFEDLSSIHLKIAPAVNDIIGKNEEALTNYVERDITILPSTRVSKNESVHETKPITSSVHELISRDTPSKSASITIKTIDSTIKPSIRSSLAETNLFTPKSLPEQLAQQETLILNKTFTLPPFLEDNYKSVDKKSSIKIKKSTSDSKMLDKTDESVDITALNKQDNTPKTLPKQIVHQDNDKLSNALTLPLSLEINEKKLSNRSSIHSRSSKSDSQKFYEIFKSEYDIVSSTLDNEVNKDLMNDDYKVDFKDETINLIFSTGRNLEISNLLEAVVGDDKKEPSILNSSVSSKTNESSRVHKSADNQINSAGKDTVPSPMTSRPELTSEMKKQQSNLFFESADRYLSSKTKEPVPLKLVEADVNLNPKDKYTIKNGSTEYLTNDLLGDKIENNQIYLQCNLSEDNRLSEDTSKYDNDYTFKNQVQNKHSETDELTNLENSSDRKSIHSTPSKVIKSTISEISSTNYEGKVIKNDQSEQNKYESEDSTLEKSNIKAEFKERLPETSPQPHENADSTVMASLQQEEDLSHIDSTSIHNVLAAQNVENIGFNIRKVTLPSKEDLLKKDINIQSAEITTNFKLQVAKEVLESNKLHEQNNINSTEELAIVLHDGKNQFRDSVVEKNIPNSQIDNSTNQLLDDKPKTLQVIGTKESLNYSPKATIEDISRMLPDQYGEQVNMEMKHTQSYPNIDYSNTYSTLEPIEVHDSMIQNISESKVNGMESIDATIMKHDSEKTAEIMTDKNIAIKYNKLTNHEISQHFIATLSGKISSESRKKNLINEPANEIDGSELNKSVPLEIQYTTMSLYSPNRKDKQNEIINNVDNKLEVSKMEKPKTEKLSTIFNVVAIPDTTKLKRDITALKSCSVLYTPSENTITKAIGKETVAMDLAFHSYVNKENKIILKTFDSEIEPMRYSDDRIIIIKSNINLYNNEMKFPIDSENSLFLQIKNVNKMDDIQQNVLKDAEKVNLADIVANKLQTHDAMAPNFHSIYEKELLPLQNAMKDLKAEIDHLARHSSILKDSLITRKSKNLRLTNINKRCVCLKRLF